MSLSVLGIALTVFACRDITAPRIGSDLTASRLLNPVGTVVVSPGNMRGWGFYDDQAGTVCANGVVCLLVSGPGTPPAGAGSAELATPLSTDGKALILQDYKGTRFDAITDLHYATYRQSADAGNNLAIALQFNADYDLTDQAVGYQGRLVYEPYQGAGGNVPRETWQTWDAKAGKWWGTKSSVPVGGVLRSNPCIQATPCTWAQLLATFPNVGVHDSFGAVVLKAGSNWPGFRGNVDKLTIGVNGSATTFDFELSAPAAAVPLVPPHFFPQALFDSLGTVTGAPLSGGPFRRDIVTVAFKLDAPLAARQAAIDSIGGVVVGGRRYPEIDDGTYYVQIRGGTTAALLAALQILHRQPQVAMATWWALSHPDEHMYRRPRDGFGWRDWVLDSTKLSATRPNWALEYVRAPMAWGCSVGSFSTAIAVIDDKVGYTDNIAGNLDYGASKVLGSFDPSIDYRNAPNSDHGARVASVLAATGNDTVGMTGMAWSARLIIRDRYSLIDHPTQSVDATNQEEVMRLLQDHIVASGTAGASVINLSMGVKWPNGEDRSDVDRMEQAEQAHEAVNLSIERLARQGLHPLLVIAAGNYHVPAELSGYAAAKDDYPGQVLVVGGLDAGGGIWSQSNTGSLIDVYAPAVHVAQANGNNRIVLDEMGTSFAAPLAAGTAVLLKDFDPSLTAADMIAMIKAGARSQDGVQKLDAYGALKQAGRRPKAPLCGNRVYKSGDNVVAVRGDGGPTETLFTLLGQTPDSGNSTIDVYHGGKRIDLSFSVQYNWKADSRTFEGPTDWTYDSNAWDGGTFLSGAGISHDYEVSGHAFGPSSLESAPATTHSPQFAWRSGSTSFQIEVAEIPVSRPTTAVVVGRVPATADGINFDSAFVDYDTAHVGGWTQPRMDTRGNAFAVAMSPGGKYALVAVNFIEVTTTATSTLRDCTEPSFFDLPPAQCADGTESAVSDHANIYRVDLVAQSAPRLIKTLAGAEIAWMSLSERDDEIVWQAVRRSTFTDFRYAPFATAPPTYGGTIDSVRTSSTTCAGRKIEYLAFDSSAVAPSPIGAAKVDAIPVVDGCNDDHSYLAGTMSPSRTPTERQGLEPLKTRAAQERPWQRRISPNARTRRSAGQ